jgi:hypothetical protein
MKSLLTLAFMCGALLFGGCADNSLMTEEDYYKTRGPAANSPDFSRNLPYSPHTSRRY